MSEPINAKTATLWAFGALFLGVLLWTAFTDIDYGVYADGYLANRYANIPVQHNAVAKVIDVQVREGTRVKAGDILLVLDDSEAIAEAGHIESQRFTELLQLYAYRSELKGIAEVPMPAKDGIALQRNALSRAHEEIQKALRQRINAHMSQMEQFETDVRSAQAQIRSVAEELNRLSEQASIIDREITAITPLVEERLLARNLLDEKRYRRAELQRTSIGLSAERTKYESMIEQTVNKRKAYLADREKEIRSHIAQLEPQLESSSVTVAAANAKLQSKVIRASADGQIINVKVKSAGEVIQPGAILMELVQQSRKYYVEARIHIAEIENIKPGMLAEVHFVTLPSKSTPYVEGALSAVASNSTINEKSGEQYYIAIIDFKTDIAAAIDTEPTLGMPVQVLLKGGRRSVMSYITEPFRTLARKSMKES